MRYFKNNTFQYVFLNIVEFIIHPLFILLVVPIIVGAHGATGLGYWMFLIALYSLGGILNLGISSATLQFLNPQDLNYRSDAFKKIMKYFLKFESILFVLLFIILLHLPDLYNSDSFTIRIPVLLLILLYLILEQIDLQLAAFLKIADFIKLNSIVDICFRVTGVTLGVLFLNITKEIDSYFAVVACLQFVKTGIKWSFFQSKKFLDQSNTFSKISNNNAGKSFFFVASGFLLLAINGYFLMMAERFLLPAFLGFELSGKIAIASQFAFLVHLMPAAAMGFLLPKLSSTSNKVGFIRTFGISSILTLIVASCAVFFMKYLFDTWFGQPDPIVQQIFWTLLLPVTLFSFAIVPYFYVAATNSVWTLSVSTLAASSLFIVCLYLLPHFDFGVEEFLLLKSSFIILSTVIIYVIYFKKIHKKKVKTSNS